MDEKIKSGEIPAENVVSPEVAATEDVVETVPVDEVETAEAVETPATEDVAAPVETEQEPVTKTEKTDEETVEAEKTDEDEGEKAVETEEPVEEEETVDAEEPVEEEETVDAEETVEPEEPVEEEAVEEEEVNYSEKTLSELINLFEELLGKENRMRLNKEADAIKSAFHKKLRTERENVTDPVLEDILTGLENDFKRFYDSYKKERKEYNDRLEKEREENLVGKEAVIEDLKALVEKQEEVNATFPQFREIQNRWRALGPVPARSVSAINETYQLYVEKFYDKVKINRELRDLDFKKNYEAKVKFCETAEKLTESSNIVSAFKELQKLHEQWKEYGPVAKQYREEIWERFKAATAIINKKYQEHFEGLKEQYSENLAAKTALCEKLEEIAARELKSVSEWNAGAKEIGEIQKEWKKIGFATKKENQKIYERFRAACDKFFERKREHYNGLKSDLNDNYDKKVALCEEAEALKTSTEWKKTTDQFLSLQKQWKEIGAVPRKKSEQLWKRFRAACDEFFAERDKNAKPENNFYGNLKAKQKLIEEINAYEPTGDEKDSVAQEDFAKRWQEIGFVPFKEKENINKAYRDAVNAKFGSPSNNGRGGRRQRTLSPRERLVQRYNELQQELATYENNIGFFAQSKSAAPLIAQTQEKIDKTKVELKSLEDEIRNLESEEN